MEVQVTASSSELGLLAIFILMEFFSVGISLLGPLGLILGLLILGLFDTFLYPYGFADPVVVDSFDPLHGFACLVSADGSAHLHGFACLVADGSACLTGLPVSSLMGLLVFTGLSCLSL